MNKKKIIIIVSVVVMLLSAGVVSAIVFANKPAEDKKNNKDNNTPIVENKEEIKIVDVNSKSRPYAVMINNHNDARRVQSGLSEAYLVYEIIVEGGITRYLALYKDASTAKIGSVRSARHYYLDYVLENDAIFVHWGQSPQAETDIKSLKINNINGIAYEGVYFYRDNPLGISSEHTGFTTMEMLEKATAKKKYRTETDKGMLLEYSAEAIDLSNKEGVKDATDVTVKYSNYTNNVYKYDESTKLYKRYVGSKEQNDFATGEQLSVKNIIVYAVNNYTIKGDTSGRQVLENIGSGTGYYISEGKAVNIKWSKESRDSKTVYTYEDGSPLIVNDGNTFIQIMPESGSLVIN